MPSAQLTTQYCLPHAQAYLPLMPARDLVPATSHPLLPLFYAFVTLPFPGPSLTPTPLSPITHLIAVQNLLWLGVAVGMSDSWTRSEGPLG